MVVEANCSKNMDNCSKIMVMEEKEKPGCELNV